MFILFNQIFMYVYLVQSDIYVCLLDQSDIYVYLVQSDMFILLQKVKITFFSVIIST